MASLATVERRKWYHIQWFADTDTKEERKLIMKLDLLIVPYAFLSYWVKYMDQGNLSKLSDRSITCHTKRYQIMHTLRASRRIWDLKAINLSIYRRCTLSAPSSGSCHSYSCSPSFPCTG